MRKTLLGIVIGGIIFGSIGVFGASYLYSAKEVSYKNTTVDAAINNLYDVSDLTSRISALEEKQTWKKLSTTTSATGSWTMPSEWTEAYIKVDIDSSHNGYTYYILKDSIPDSPGYLWVTEGFSNGASNAAVIICNKQKISMDGRITVNNTTYTNITEATLYYR